MNHHKSARAEDVEESQELSELPSLYSATSVSDNLLHNLETRTPTLSSRYDSSLPFFNEDSIAPPYRVIGSGNLTDENREEPHSRYNETTSHHLQSSQDVGTILDGIGARAGAEWFDHDVHSPYRLFAEGSYNHLFDPDNAEVASYHPILQEEEAFASSSRTGSNFGKQSEISATLPTHHVRNVDPDPGPKQPLIRPLQDGKRDSNIYQGNYWAWAWKMRWMALQSKIVDKVAETLGLVALEEIFAHERASHYVNDILYTFGVSLEKDFERFTKSYRDKTAYLQVISFIKSHRREIESALRRRTSSEPHGSKYLSLADRDSRIVFTDAPNTSSLRPLSKSSNKTRTVDGERPPPFELAKAEEEILNCSAWDWLIDRLQQLTSMSQTGDESLSVRSQLAALYEFSRPRDNLTLELRWNPIAFLEKEDLSGSLRLSDVIVYCGAFNNSCALPVSEYLEFAWPGLGQGIIQCLTEACTTKERLAHFKIYDLKVEIEMLDANTFVRVHWAASWVREESENFDAILTVAEAFIWMAVACRTNYEDDSVGACVPRLYMADTYAHSTHHVVMIPVYANGVGVDRTSFRGTCWRGMVRNPVIAFGYPIPLRNSDEQRGLEVSPGLMIALSQANWATTFDEKFVLKGLMTALVPVTVEDTWIAWHFLINDDRSQMTYRQACVEACTSSAETVDATSLSNRRHFVGVWTTEATKMLGSADSLCDIGYSGGKQANSHTLSLSSLSISGGKFLSATAGGTISRKDRSALLSFKENEPYQVQIHNASEIQVLFYGSEDRRAWLVDGASAVLHLARLWMSSPKARYMNPDAFDHLEGLQTHDGRQAALDALMANKSISIFMSEKKDRTQAERQPTESQSSQSSRSRSSQTEESTKAGVERSNSDWTYRDLIVSLCEVLQTIHEKVTSLEYGPPGFEFAKRSSRPILNGFEANDLILRQGPHRPRSVTLLAHARDWQCLVKEHCAVVLLAKKFGDLIRPREKEATCLRTSLMCSDHDLLAVPLELLKHLSRRWDQSCHGCVQVSESIWWHSSSPVDDDFSCRDISSCQIYSWLGPKATQPKHKVSNTHSTTEVLDLYPRGAAIIVGRRQRGRTFPSCRRHNTDAGSPTILDRLSKLDFGRKERYQHTEQIDDGTDRSSASTGVQSTENTSVSASLSPIRSDQQATSTLFQSEAGAADSDEIPKAKRKRHE